MKLSGNNMKSSKKLKDEQMRSILFEYYEEKGKRMLQIEPINSVSKALEIFKGIN